jgi:membrane protein implicated in regulation of membrane protease activity
VNPVTVTFLAIGCVSLAWLGLALVGVGHGHGHLHLHHGGIQLSLPALAGFIGAFGFAGGIAAELSGHNAWLAVGVGLAAAVPTAWLAGRVMAAAANMSTDATLTSRDLVGATGVVISPVPVNGYGEVRLRIAGQEIKFYARSAQPLALGTHVLVVEVPTPTSVLVEPTPYVL